MKRRWRLALYLGLGLLTVMGFWLWQGLRASGATANWMIASNPILTRRANTNGAPNVVLVLSNCGPGDLDFSFPWIDCRSGSELNMVPAKPPRRGGSVTLQRGAATNIVIELGKAGESGELLFCCQVHWLQGDSRLRRLERRLDAPIYWLAAFLELNWSPPWRNRPFHSGDAFASNVDVEEFFKRVYGFTRQTLEQDRLKREAEVNGQPELARPEPGVPEGSVRRAVFVMRPMLTDAEQAREEAKTAFADFCIASTNAAQSSGRP